MAFNYGGGPRGGEKEGGEGVCGIAGVVGRGSGRVGPGVAAARKGMDEGGVKVLREEGLVVAIAVEVGATVAAASAAVAAAEAEAEGVGAVDAEICSEVAKAGGWRRLSGLDGWGMAWTRRSAAVAATARRG